MLRFQRWLDRVLVLKRVAMGRLRCRIWRMRGARIGHKSQFGARTLISGPWRISTGQRCVIESDVTLKLVNDDSSLVLGDFCYVARFAQFDILGKCEIGHHVLIATGCMIIDHNHGTDCGLRIDQQMCVAKPVTIGNDVWLGAYSTILPGVSLGDGAVVGAHACVTKDVPPLAIVVGVPARTIGFRNAANAVRESHWDASCQP
jgi:acetyltransferase-like isoleucine patch superfamily enzyme